MYGIYAHAILLVCAHPNLYKHTYAWHTYLHVYFDSEKYIFPFSFPLKTILFFHPYVTNISVEKVSETVNRFSISLDAQLILDRILNNR